MLFQEFTNDFEYNLSKYYIFIYYYMSIKYFELDKSSY